MDRKLERQLKQVHAVWGRERASRVPAERRQGFPIYWPTTPSKPGEPVTLSDRGTRSCVSAGFLLFAVGVPLLGISFPENLHAPMSFIWLLSSLLGLAAFWLLWGKRTVRFGADGLCVASYFWPRKKVTQSLPLEGIRGLRIDTYVEVETDGSGTQHWLWVVAADGTEHGVCYSTHQEDTQKLFDHVRELWRLSSVASDGDSLL